MPGNSGGHRRVAFVEDRGTLRELVSEALTLDGFEVDSFPDAESLLRVLPTLDPAILVTDLRLPGMDGESLAARVRAEARFADLPAIFLTAAVASSGPGPLPGSRVLAKPFDLKDLLDEVQAACRREGTNREPTAL